MNNRLANGAMRLRKQAKLFACGASIAMIASGVQAIPPHTELVVANNNQAGSTTIGAIKPDGVASGAWVNAGPYSTTSPSTQKTIGASSTMVAIVYRDAAGYDVMESVPITTATYQANWTSAFNGTQEFIFTDPLASTPAKIIPEEIEVDPVSNDVFVLGDTGPSTAKQIFRIHRSGQGGQLIATAMTTATSPFIPTPNGNRVFVNPTRNGFKSGSIAFVPDPAGGSFLVFTHESNVYGICQWIYKVYNDSAHENFLGNQPSKNGCWAKINGVPKIPGTGGLNSVYVGHHPLNTVQNMLLVSRDNGPLYEFNTGLVPNPANPVVWPAAPTAPGLQNDLAWYRNGLP